MKRIHNVGVFPMLAWMSLFSVPQILIVSWLLEDAQMHLLATLPLSAFLGALYAAVGSTIVAYGLWYYLMKKYDVSQVSPFSLLSPVFGITLGQVFFHEPLSAQMIAGGLITILGVGIIVFRRPKLVVLGKG